jgi:RimJ/RimL family protein N-acetyltransferase
VLRAPMTALATARLRLDPIREADVDDGWSGLWSDAEVTRYLPPRAPLPRDGMEPRIARACAHWAQHGFGIWIVRDRETGAFVGHCGLVHNAPAETELVYALRRSAWGQGIAREASIAVLEHGLRRLGLIEIIGLVFPENRASSRVLEQLGFERAGETFRFDTDLLRYRLVESQFQR